MDGRTASAQSYHGVVDLATLHQPANSLFGSQAFFFDNFRFSKRLVLGYTEIDWKNASI